MTPNDVMMSDCQKCGDAGAKEVEAMSGGLLFDTAQVCGSCLAVFLDGLEWWRGQFNALLDAGTTRAEANRQIIERMRRGELPVETPDEDEVDNALMDERAGEPTVPWETVKANLDLAEDENPDDANEEEEPAE